MDKKKISNKKGSILLLIISIILIIASLILIIKTGDDGELTGGFSLIIFGPVFIIGIILLIQSVRQLSKIYK